MLTALNLLTPSTSRDLRTTLPCGTARLLNNFDFRTIPYQEQCFLSDSVARTTIWFKRLIDDGGFSSARDIQSSAPTQILEGSIHLMTATTYQRTPGLAVLGQPERSGTQGRLASGNWQQLGRSPFAPFYPKLLFSSPR